MRNFYLEEIAKIMGGNIITSNKSRSVQLFTTQPKDQPLPDSLYFLFNGCDNEEKLLKQIKENNAAGIVVRNNHRLDVYKWERQGITIIEVPHMTKQYIDLSKLYRNQFDIPFVEVIGSSGKTTTKEMIGAVLNERMSTLVGLKNYNSPSGVAYNIFRLREHYKAAVLEVGIKGKGIMEYSSKIVKPHIAVVTSIHRAHLISMGSIENIIEAKSGILKCLSKDGTLIINGEDKNCNKFPVNRFGGEVLRFGFSNKFDIYASDIKYRDFTTSFKAIGKGFEVNCVINTVGRYNVANALAAVLTGIKLGLSPQEISNGLFKFKTLDGRLKLHNGIFNTILVDDNFNANPDSTELFIKEIPYFTEGRPVVLVIGDMERPDDAAEKYARKVHFKIGQEISKIKLQYLVAIGKWAEEYVKGVLSKGYYKDNIIYFRTVEEAENHILDYIIPDSVVLFKASLYTKVNKLMKLLKVH